MFETNSAVCEPLRRIIDQHNVFNRWLKLLFGSLNSVMQDGLGRNQTVVLPYGEEPWGEPKTWSSADDGHAAAQLLAELGIVRAASAFEDYLQGVIDEIDRAKVPTPTAKQKNPIDRVLRRLSFQSSAGPSLAMVRFFDCARNCIVHQMGRANSELVELSPATDLQKALDVAGARKKAKWKPAIPPISLGAAVSWKPRHAILASEAYYRVAVAIDGKLVNLLGQARFVSMAAYWAVSSPVPVVAARRSLVATIRSELSERYRVSIEANEIGPLLKSVGKWDRITAQFRQRYPDRPFA